MTLFLDGAAGPIQLLLEAPAGAARGIAVISHPQPLLGGTPAHPVPHAIARRLLERGWIAARPSFRGVDGSAGHYDGGVGEAEDTVQVVQALRARHPGLPLALVGFSFGAHVHARSACLLEADAPAEAVVLLGLPIGAAGGNRHYEAMPLPARTLLLHGELDEMAPLPNLLDWARPRRHPVTVFAGSNHFFKGCLERALDDVALHLQQLPPGRRQHD